MADGGLMVVDGAQLRGGDLLLPIPDGAVTGACLFELAESEVAARLFGLTLPESLRSAARRRVGAEDDAFLSEEFNDAESLKEKLRDYLLALADELKDDPLVVSVLDGSALHLFLDDEDDFAVLAENLFTDLDINDTGKLSKSELKNALVHMGVEMGVPPWSESADLLNNVLKKHETEGEELLGQAQFAQLLQPVLQDLADALAEKHVTVIHNIKVINGSKLNKILVDEELLDTKIEQMFEEWNACGNREAKKEKLQGILQTKGLELGLPPCESNEPVLLLYHQIFSKNEEKITGDLTREAFKVVVVDIFEQFVQQLEANPVYIEMGS